MGRTFTSETTVLTKATAFLVASETYLRSRHDLEEPTKVGYRKTFTRFARTNDALGDLTAENVNAFLAQEEHAPTMARNDAIALRGMGKWSARVGVFRRNPLETVELPKGRGGHREPIRDQDVPKIIRAAEDSALGFRDKAIVVLAFSAALRVPSELFQLRVEDVDTRGGWVTVRRDTTKTDAGVRTIPLDPKAVAALEEYLAVRPGIGGSLWLNNHGDPFTKYGFDSVLYRLVRKMREQGIVFTPYQMRHTGITNWVRAGVETPIVKQLAGHKSIVTTQNYVGKIGREELRQIPSAFSRIYGKAV